MSSNPSRSMQERHPQSDRTELEFELRFDKPVDQIWPLIGNRENLTKWYALPVLEMDPRAGGAMKFDDGEGGTIAGTIEEHTPPTRFSFREHGEGINDEAVMELHPDASGEGCRFVFIHKFDNLEDEILKLNIEGWNACFDDLESLARES